MQGVGVREGNFNTVVNGGEFILLSLAVFHAKCKFLI